MSFSGCTAQSDRATASDGVGQANIANASDKTASANHEAVSSAPWTPAEVLAQFGHLLTDYERDEILECRSVYYIGASAKKLRPSTKPARNWGFDGEKGRYRCILNDHLNYRYQIIGELGQGTFGDVVRAFDHKTQAQVAVKITRNEPRLSKQAEAEVKLLEYIKNKDKRNDNNVVRIQDRFVFRGHVCVVFEILQEDLFAALKTSGFHGFETEDIKSLTTDVLVALRYLSDISIVHCDLKPENIVFRNHDSNHVKLIDFGSSCYGKNLFNGEVQSMFYRAPEVLLEAGFNTPIDMWSLGCVVAELHMGHPLFPGRCPEEQLMLQMEVLGLPPAELLDEGSFTETYFDDFNRPLYIVDKKGVLHAPGSKSLAEVLGGDASEEMVSFIKACLTWTPEERMTPAEAFLHPFVCGSAPAPVAITELLTTSPVSCPVSIPTITTTPAVTSFKIPIATCTHSLDSQISLAMTDCPASPTSETSSHMLLTPQLSPKPHPPADAAFTRRETAI